MIFGPDGTRIGQAVADDVSGMSSGEGGWLFAMADDLMKQAYRLGRPNYINPRGKYSNAAHVETNYAAWMVMRGVKEVHVVINNKGGLCSSLINCTESVQDMPPKGYTMHVWWGTGEVSTPR
ncbi:hypothetical protein JCM9533A_41600 [Catenuloplanes niger JCM 9533]